MDIILLERVEKLGSIGDVVTVKDGFARNYLLPNKKALRANDANRKVFEANRERIETTNAERRGVAAHIPNLDPNPSNVRVFNLIDLDPLFAGQ